VTLGQVFSEYFGVPCQSPFQQLLHNHHHLSSGAGPIGSGRSTKWTQSHPTKNNNKKSSVLEGRKDRFETWTKPSQFRASTLFSRYDARYLLARLHALSETRHRTSDRVIGTFV
jgi:hypothetical protein